jgi:hypothetical protein
VREAGLFTPFTMIWKLLLSERRIYVLRNFFLYKIISLITNSNLKLKTIYLISNCKTHNSMFNLLYLSGLNINSTLYAINLYDGTNGLLISP